MPVTGAGEQISFEDRYVNANNHSVANLHMVIEGTTDYDASSANQLNNTKTVRFDFDDSTSRVAQHVEPRSASTVAMSPD